MNPVSAATKVTKSEPARKGTSGQTHTLSALVGQGTHSATPSGTASRRPAPMAGSNLGRAASLLRRANRRAELGNQVGNHEARGRWGRWGVWGRAKTRNGQPQGAGEATASTCQATAGERPGSDDRGRNARAKSHGPAYGERLEEHGATDRKFWGGG